MFGFWLQLCVVLDRFTLTSNNILKEIYMRTGKVAVLLKGNSVDDHHLATWKHLSLKCTHLIGCGGASGEMISNPCSLSWAGKPRPIYNRNTQLNVVILNILLAMGLCPVSDIYDFDEQCQIMAKATTKRPKIQMN